MTFTRWWKHARLPVPKKAPDNEAYLTARIAWDAAIAEAVAVASRWNDSTDPAFSDIVKAIRKLRNPPSTTPRP